MTSVTVAADGARADRAPWGPYPRGVPVDERPSVRSSALRAKTEHLSDPLVQRLARLPKVAPLVAVIVLVVVGAVFRHVVGAVCFGVCAVLTGWLLYLAWPRLASVERMMRGATLLLLAAITVVCAAG